MNKIQIYNTKTELYLGFTNFMIDLLKSKSQFHICLSGGNTPKSLFDFWAENYKDKIPWEKISFYWGDERCVPPENEMSNFGMTKKHLFDKINIPEKNIFRIHGENTAEIEAERYSKIIPEKFDLIMLGMGDDGHTASIFPNQINLWNSSKKCEVTIHPETGFKRISITGIVINNAQNIAFLITGKNKAEKVSSIINQREKYENIYPAAQVNPKSTNLYWFLDSDAGEYIKPLYQ